MKKIYTFILIIVLLFTFVSHVFASDTAREEVSAESSAVEFDLDELLSSGELTDLIINDDGSYEYRSDGKYDYVLDIDPDSGEVTKVTRVPVEFENSRSTRPAASTATGAAAKAGNAVKINTVYSINFTSVAEWHNLMPGGVIPLLNEAIEISWSKPSGSGVSTMSFMVCIAGSDTQIFPNVPAGALNEVQVKALREYYILVKSDEGTGEANISVRAK